MILLGLTGGVGMGKSTSARLLGERGLPIIDTDLLAHELVEPGQPALAEIQAAFGYDIIGPDHRLDRARLARRVFSDPAARQQLEAILHPRIRQRWLAQVEMLAQQPTAECVVVIPLLFETHAELEFDHVICVACSAAAQYERLLARGWDDQQIRQRIAAQWSIDKKIFLSEFVIWTDGSLGVHGEQLDYILSIVREESGAVQQASDS
jgi:dephospho-CoA kinase